ncbi:MAG: membrane protease subunit [Candidatus Nitrosotenuis sp.]
MSALIGIVLAIICAAFALFTERSDEKGNTQLSVSGIIAIFFGIIFAVVGIVLNPLVNVWVSEMNGKAEYAQAEYNRQIKVLEALATLESAKSYAAAEVERAKGVAQANEIIKSGLGGSDGYLRYLYIQAIEKASEHGTMQFVYVPTEAGLPILEANRLQKATP